MKEQEFDRLQIELSVKAKNGIDFITAATLIWIGITVIWAQDLTAYNKSIFTFIVSGVMLPLAFALSKVYKTIWTVKENPLQPLGLILNIAQLFYFPFLFFILSKSPDHFVMTYAIITGAHFFPYFWYYKEKAFAIIGGLIAVGSFLIGIKVESTQMFYIPAFTGFCLFVLGIFIYKSAKERAKSSNGDG
ncbi:MAG: hypothetical protein AAFQ94_16430 [Bacteroidota bacterium]